MNTLMINGMKFNKQQDIVEEFNKYFTSVAEKNKKRQISMNYITVIGSENTVNLTDFMGQAFIDKYQTMKYY
jgi:hypothetical protein